MRWPEQLPNPQGTGTDLEAPHRRLVVMFDGTWNERENLTNVARMFEAIDDYQPAGYKYSVEFGHTHDMDPLLYKGPEPVQLVKYLKGVGTNVVGHYLGGAVGFGLSDIIKKAYLWLSQNYVEGDEIFVFGFSRGAYSARSLVSLIHRCRGVLELNMDNHGYSDRPVPFPGSVVKTTTDLLEEAYDMHKNFQDTVEHAKKMKDFGENYCQHVTIKMLGVWDTVGSVGVSLKKDSFLDKWFHGWSSSHYDLIHGQELPCIVENAYHALAIDEHREPFQPTLWKSKKRGNKIVEQKWFIGSHCNVGGGATAINEGGDEDPDDLFQYSYVWMQNKAHELGLRFSWLYTPLGFQTPAGAQIPRRVTRTKPEDSYKQMMRLPFMKEGIYCKWRQPVNRPVLDSTGNLVFGSSLDWSVTERINQDPEYLPPSLLVPNEKNPKLYTKFGCTDLEVKKCSCENSHEHSESVAATISKSL